MSGSSSSGFCPVLSRLSDALAFVSSPSPAPKQRRVVEGIAPAVAAPDMAESSKRAGGAGSQPSKKIPVGEPIIPHYIGSKALPFARLLHEDRVACVSPEVEEESSDSLLEEITASPLTSIAIMVKSLRMIRS